MARQETNDYASKGLAQMLTEVKGMLAEQQSAAETATTR